MALLYGSLLPLRVDGHTLGSTPWLGLSEIAWCRTTPEDALTNVLVYVPLGMLLFLSRVGLGCGAFGMLLSLTLGVTLSISAECLQTGIAERVASWTDMVLNALGTITGVLAAAIGWAAAPWYVRPLRRHWYDNPLSIIVVALTLGLVLYGLFPFDWVTSTSGLHSAFQQGWVGLAITGPGSGSSVGHSPVGELTSAAWFAALGFLAVHAARYAGSPPAAAFAAGIQHACITGALIEVLQVFTESHTFDSGSLTLRWAGAAAGAWYAAFLTERPVSPAGGCAGAEAASSRIIASALVFQIAAIFLRSLDAGSVASYTVQPVSVRWLPFEALWRLAAFQAAGELASTVVIYSVLAGTSAAWLAQQQAPRPWLAATIGVFVIACLRESLIAVACRGAFDTTTPTIATLTALLAGHIGRSPGIRRMTAGIPFAPLMAAASVSSAQVTPGR